MSVASKSSSKLFIGAGSLAAAFVAALAFGLFVTPQQAEAGSKSRVSFSLGISSGHGHHGHHGHYRSRGHYSSRHHSHHRSSFGIGFSTGYRSYCAPTYRHRYTYHRPTYYRSYSYCPPPVTTRVVHHYATPAPVTRTTCVVKHYPGTTTKYCTTHSYGHPSCGVYSTSSTTTRVYTAPIETARTYNYGYTDSAPAKPQPTVATDGWAALKYGNAHDAATAFAQEAERYPKRGLPRIGCAVAKAQFGEDAGAVFAMRHAVKHDATSLNQLPLDQPLRDKLGRMIARYRDKSQYTCSPTDALFMAAASHYMLGEFANADSAVRAGIEAGDADEATRVLQRMIAAKLANAYNYGYSN